MKAFLWLIAVEFKLLTRKGNTVLQPLLLFSLITLLFPFSLSSMESDLLLNFAPSIIWVAALLAVLMELNHIFYDDFDDGTLEQILLHQSSVIGFIHAKIIAYWFRTGFLISLCSPVVSLALGSNYSDSLLLFVSLSLGTLVLSYLGAFISSLLIASKQNNLLTALLALPFYIPVIIFGATLSSATATSPFGLSAFYFLLALLVLSAAICPIAIQYSLRYGVQ